VGGTEKIMEQDIGGKVSEWIEKIRRSFGKKKKSVGGSNEGDDGYGTMVG